MVTDEQLARLISGDMDAAERADFAERVRRIVLAALALIDVAEPNYDLDDSRTNRAIRTAEDALGVCVFPHDANTRQRNGACLRCGELLK